jgi:hypothetical protein
MPLLSRGIFYAGYFHPLDFMLKKQFHPFIFEIHEKQESNSPLMQ